MKVLDPIETTGLNSDDVNDLTTRVHDNMQNVFNELNTQMNALKSNLAESNLSDSYETDKSH